MLGIEICDLLGIEGVVMIVEGFGLLDVVIEMKLYKRLVLIDGIYIDSGLVI